MPARYLPLATISFQHGYYKDRVMRGFTLHPVPATAKSIRNFRLTMRQDAAQFRLLQEHRSEGDTASPVVPVDKPVDLVFGFRSNDADFQVRTELDFFSSNKQKIVIDLRTPPEEGAPLFRQLPVAFSQAVFVPQEPVTGLLELQNSAGEKIASRQLKEENAPVVFNLPETAEDIYSFVLAGEKQNDFLLLHNDSEFEAVLLLRIQQDAPLEKQLFFPARSIFWQYSIEQKYNVYPGLELVDETENIVFRKTEDASRPGAVHFISADPILLHEQYSFRLLLQDNGRIVRKNIPNANMKNVGRCLQNVHYLCLENYVFV